MDSHIYQVSSNGTSGNIYIGNFQKNGCIGPDAFANATWIHKSGLQLTMWSYDKFPIAQCTDPEGPINKDSYLACYIDFFPRYRYKGYVSVEINANGICKCSFGPNKVDRESFCEMDLPQLDVEISHPSRDGGRCWMAKTTIPVETIQAIYNLPCKLQPGHQMRANFFTACESGHAPYWGSWAPVEKPGFHFTEYFGKLELI